MPERRQQARNVHHLAIMTALVVIPAQQLLYGPEGSVVVLSMPEAAQRIFAWLLLISATLVLASTVTRDVPRQEWLPPASFLEFAGQLGIASALTVYSLTLQDKVPFWNTSLGIGFAFVAAASLIRAVVVALYIRRHFTIQPKCWRHLVRRLTR